MAFNITHTLEDVTKYKEVNDFIPLIFSTLCEREKHANITLSNEILDEMKNIINYRINKQDPNDILFKKNIIEIFNKVENPNDCEIEVSFYIDSFNDKVNKFDILSNELIVRCMNDNFISSHNLSFDPYNTNTLTKSYVTLMVKLINKYEGLRDIFAQKCRLYFRDFLIESKELDDNNAHRVENYKGFMYMLGMCSIENIIAHQTIISCINAIISKMKSYSWIEKSKCNLFQGADILMYIITWINNSPLCNNNYLITKDLIQKLFDDEDYVKLFNDLHIEIIMRRYLNNVNITNNSVSNTNT